MLHPDKLLIELYRILKPRGVVVVSTPNVNGLSAKIMKDKWLYFKPPEHLHYFSPSSLSIFLEANGFRIRKVRTENIYINHIFIQKFCRKISRKEMRSSTSKISKNISKHTSSVGSLPFCVGNDHNIFVNGLAPNKIFYAIPSSLFSAAAELAALKHPRRPTQSCTLARRRLYGEKTVRKAERARFLSEGEESEALNRIAFDSLGQKQRVLEL